MRAPERPAGRRRASKAARIGETRPRGRCVRTAGFLLLLLALPSIPWIAPPRASGAAESPARAEAGPTGDEPLDVFVSILPQAGLIERLGGERVRVHVLIRPGQEPHTFEPTPRQIALLSEARLYFRIGLPFEEFLLSRIGDSHPDLRIIDMGAGVARRAFSEEPAEHAKGGEGTNGDEQERHGAEAGKEESAVAGDAAHSHGTDPHIWLSPRLLPILARNGAEALIDEDPNGRELYERNLAAFVEEAQATDRSITARLAPYHGRAFYVFHPSFGYFADAYGLKQVAVEVEGQSPSARQLAGLIGRARRDDVKVIFVQPQFSRRSAQSVAQGIGGRVVPLDPLAKDVLENLETMAAEIAAAMGS